MSELRDDHYRKPEVSRALVAVEQARGGRASGSVRPLATFIAQVLACRAKFPEFRQNRRAKPQAASTIYGTAEHVRRPSRFERTL